MKRDKDISGVVFSRLTAVKKKHGGEDKLGVWECICECGNKYDVSIYSLLNGKTGSCGCLQRDRTSSANSTHKMSKTPEYKTWCHMISRCSCKTDKSYKRYGGRLISVCKRWESSFENFILDMGNKPYSNMSIDRIDNDGNYSPDNCKWSTPAEQSDNRSTAVLITLQGITMSVKKWSDLVGIKYFTLIQRISAGWTPSDAILTPTRCKRGTLEVHK